MPDVSLLVLVDFVKGDILDCIAKNVSITIDSIAPVWVVAKGVASQANGDGLS